MTKYYQLRAPASMSLEKMSDPEIDKMVADQADRMLEALPDELRPVGVQGVVLDSVKAGTAAAPGVWAQWTRACCDKRKRIEDFREPITEEMMEAAKALRPASYEHIESQLSIQTLSNPRMHPETGAKKKR